MSYTKPADIQKRSIGSNRRDSDLGPNLDRRWRSLLKCASTWPREHGQTSSEMETYFLKQPISVEQKLEAVHISQKSIFCGVTPSNRWAVLKTLSVPILPSPMVEVSIMDLGRHNAWSHCQPQTNHGTL